MSAKEDVKLPELPEEFPHIFTEVIFQLVPEVDYSDLVYLSQLLKIRKREEIYGPLADALRKIQWTKLASMEAIAIEKETVKLVEDEVIAFYPAGQVQYAKAVFDVVILTKSALDSVAVFLTELLSIPATREQRDFKRGSFRKQIIEKDTVIGQNTKSLEQWFRDVQDLRDKWIHRISTRIFVTFGPTEIGLLPVPKVVSEDSGLQDAPLIKEHYWTTQEFVELYFTKLTSFFSSIVARCIEIERDKLGTPPPYPQKSEYPIIAFPFRVMKDMKLKGFRVRL